MRLQQSPAGGGRVALLTAALVLLQVAVFAGGGVVVRKLEPSAAPVPTTTAAQVAPRTTEPSAPEVTPSRNPRRQPDVDRGTLVDHDVFVQVADGWTPMRSDHLGLRLQSWDRGAAADFYVNANPMPSAPLLRVDAETFAEFQDIYGFRAGRVRTLPLPNPNLVEAASIAFTGRRRMDGGTYSLSGECVRLRGVPETNDVSLSICWVAYVQDLDTVRAEVQQMIASAAGSV